MQEDLNLKNQIIQTRYASSYRDKHLQAIEDFLKLNRNFTSDDIAVILDAFQLMQNAALSKNDKDAELRLRAIIADVVNRFIPIMDLHSLNEAAAFYIRFWEKDHSKLEDLGKSIPIQEKWVELALKENWPAHADDDEDTCPCCDLSEWLVSTSSYYVTYAIPTDDLELLKKAKKLLEYVERIKKDLESYTRFTDFISLVNKILDKKARNPQLTLVQIEKDLTTDN